MDQGGGRHKMQTRSMVWEHFDRYIGDDGKERCKCKHCGKEYAYKGGTSNMLKHLPRCGGDQGHVGAAEQQHQLAVAPPLPMAPAPVDEEMHQEVPPIPPLPLEPGVEEHHHGPGLDEQDPRTDLVRMILLGGYHPSIVEDAHFRSFVRHLNPTFKLPACEEIQKACDTVCKDKQMADDPDDPWQQISTAACSFTIGKTRSVEAGEAVHIIYNFIDDKWNLQRLVAHAYLLSPLGDHSPGAVLSTVLGVPAVPDQVAAERVVSYVLSEDHYPLMVAGEMTGGIGHLELKRLVDQKTRKEEVEVFCTASMDQILQSIARSLFPDSDVASDILSSVLHLKKWARQDRQTRLSEHGLDNPLESSEPWYWCYCSLMIADHELNDSQTLLCNLWGAIYNGIKKISASSTPTSNLCLLELLNVRAAVHSQLSATGAANLPLTQALEVVDRAIDDSYRLWSVPLVLDPRFKLRHIEEQFQKVFDDAKAATYISRVRSVVTDLYIRYNEDSDDSDEEMMSVDRIGSQNDSPGETTAQLDEYLEDSLARAAEGMDFDILSWWNRYGSVQYPTVVKVARAALAMPTCSKLTSAQAANVKSIISGYGKI